MIGLMNDVVLLTWCTYCLENMYSIMTLHIIISNYIIIGKYFFSVQTRSDND